MLEKRTLVKLDGKLIEITFGPSGLVAKEISADEQFEVSLLGVEVQKFLENDINKITNEAYAELQRDFKRNLKSNVLKVVGFDNRYGSEWEVDHCNGRTSAITEFMSSKVKDMFNEEFNKIIQADIEKMLKPVKQAMLKDFKDSFQRHVRNQMYQQSSQAAKEFLKEEMKKQVEKFQQQFLDKTKTSFLGKKPLSSDKSDD